MNYGWRKIHRERIAKRGQGIMQEKWKWTIIGNWLISPIWYVLGWFIYMMADGAASGQYVCTGLLDIIITIFLALFLIPQVGVIYLSHYPFHLLAYYAISGTMIYAAYRIYKKHTLKESGAK